MWNFSRRDAVTRRHGDTETKSPRRRIPVSPCLLLFLLTALGSLLTGCRRDMQDQPKALTYRENLFFKDGSASRPLVDGTVPRGFLRDNHEFFFGKKLKASDLNSQQQYQTPNPPPTGNSANAFPDDVDTIPMPITRDDPDRGQARFNIYCYDCH